MVTKYMQHKLETLQVIKNSTVSPENVKRLPRKLVPGDFVCRTVWSCHKDGSTCGKLSKPWIIGKQICLVVKPSKDDIEGGIIHKSTVVMKIITISFSYKNYGGYLNSRLYLDIENGIEYPMFCNDGDKLIRNELEILESV